MPTGEYVTDLVVYPKKIIDHVREKHRKHRENEQCDHLRQHYSLRMLHRVGDYVFLEAPHSSVESKKHSERFSARKDNRLFQILHLPSLRTGDPVSAAVWCNTATRSMELGFAQLVLLGRFISTDVGSSFPVAMTTISAYAYQSSLSPSVGRAKRRWGTFQVVEMTLPGAAAWSFFSLSCPMSSLSCSLRCWLTAFRPSR